MTQSAPRIAVDLQNIVFREVPFTEISFNSSGGEFKAALAKTGQTFVLQVQEQGDVKDVTLEEVPKELLELTKKRFYYFFVRSDVVSANLAQAPAKDFKSQVFAGRPFDELGNTPFVLTGTSFINEKGQHEEGFAASALDAARDRKSPRREKSSATSTVVLFATADSFVVGTGVPFTIEVIQGFEKNGCPDPFPLFDANALFPLVRSSDDSFAFAFPAVDPVATTRALTQKYHKACDLYMAHAQDFEQPPVAKQDPEVERGYKNYLKNNLAHAFVQLLKSIPNIASELAEGGRAHQNFIDAHKKRLEELVQEREDAALNLFGWLDSDFMKEAEAWFRDDDQLITIDVDGVQTIGLSELVEAVSLSLSRSAESDAGAEFALRLLEDAKGDSPPEGIARLVDEFILPDENLGPEYTVATTSAGVEVLNAWAAFFVIVAIRTANGEALDFVRARSATGEAALSDAISVFARFPNNAFKKALIELRALREAELDGSVVEFSERLKNRLNNPLNLGGLADTMKTLSPGKEPSAGDLTKKGLGLTLSALNAIVKFAELLEEAKGNEPSPALNEATLGALEGFVAFADEIGQLTIAKNPAAKAFSHTLGLIASGLALLSAMEGARDKWEKHDWDAMGASLTEGVGAAATAFGIYMMATAPATGPTPLAGFLFFGGAVLGVGGAVWGLFAEDIPYEQLLKFSAFGNEAAASVKAPIWAQCDNFREWDPNTEDGLKLQLRAAEQLLHAFIVEGLQAPGFAANGAVRIRPSSVIAGSTFHIVYTAQYRVFSGESKAPITGYCRVDIDRAPTPSGFSGSLKNPEKTFGEENAVLIHSVEGQLVIDIFFTKLPPVVEGNRSIELANLFCKVRLDVHGDGSDAQRGADASLPVPNSKSGARFVSAITVEERQLHTEGRKSYSDVHVG